jgi:hypothetical protein
MALNLNEIFSPAAMSRQFRFPIRPQQAFSRQ